MYPRQLIAVLVAFILILAAALFVITRDGDDGDAARDVATTTTTAAAPSTTAAPPESTTTSVTTTIPTECSVEESATATTDTAEDGAAEDGANDATTTSVTPAGSTLSASSTVSTVGLDEVDFGMTVSQAEAATNTTMIACAPVSECYRVTPLDAPEGISFVVTAGTIERVDIVGGPITTRSGVGIGSTQERIIELFGDKIETRVNDDSSVDLVFVPQDDGDDQFRVVFTIRDGVVDSFRSGRVPQIDNLDPCET